MSWGGVTCYSRHPSSGQRLPVSQPQGRAYSYCIYSVQLMWYSLYSFCAFVNCVIALVHFFCVCVFCSAPDFPPRGCVAMVVSSTSFGVTWSSPDPPNGDIANYTIVYRPVEAVADYDPSTLEGNTTRYTDANTTVLMAVGLQSAVLYSIQLAATNQVGTSPFSQECTVLTQDDGE